MQYHHLLFYPVSAFSLVIAPLNRRKSYLALMRISKNKPKSRSILNLELFMVLSVNSKDPEETTRWLFPGNLVCPKPIVQFS
jgi:hypothetical protein